LQLLLSFRTGEPDFRSIFKKDVTVLMQLNPHFDVSPQRFHVFPRRVGTPIVKDFQCRKKRLPPLLLGSAEFLD
jgi:hypothetical protein